MTKTYYVEKQTDRGSKTLVAGPFTKLSDAINKELELNVKNKRMDCEYKVITL